MHDKVVGKLVRKGIDRNEAPDLAVNILLDAVEAVDKLKSCAENLYGKEAYRD